LVVSVSACALAEGKGEPEFAIVSPTEGEWVGTNAVRVQGVVGDPAIRSVVVNGETVAVSAGEFQATLRMEDGPAQVEAAAAGLVDVVSFHVDGAVPRVVIEEPPPASFIEGSSIRVVGHIEDATDATLRADGVPIDVAPDGTFAFERLVGPGAHRIRLVAEDSVGHVGSAFTTAIVGRFANAEATLPRALALSLGDAALDAIATAAEPYMSADNVRPLVMAQNPVAEGFWGEVNATGENHDPVSIEIYPDDGPLSLVLTVPNVSVPFEANLPLGLDIRGTAYVASAVIEATMAVGAVDGMPTVELARSSVDLEGVLIDVDGLWDWVDRALITNALRGTIEQSLDDAVANEVPAAIERALAALPGHRAEIRSGVSELISTAAGLRAVLDFGVRPVGGAGPAMLAAPGPLVFGSGEAPRSTLSGVEGAVTVDLVNAALFAAWGVGGLSYRMDEVPGPGGAPLDVGLVNLVLPVDGAPRDAPVSVEVDAALPPVLRATETGLEIHVADLHVRLYAPGPSGEAELAHVSCGVRAVVVPLLADDGLGFRVESLTVTIDGVEPLSGLPPADDLDRLLGELLAPLLETHGELRGLSIPTVAGLHVGADALFVERGYVVFQGSLAP
jgi:hypothetical protein